MLLRESSINRITKRLVGSLCVLFLLLEGVDFAVECGDFSLDNLLTSSLFTRLRPTSVVSAPHFAITFSHVRLCRFCVFDVSFANANSNLHGLKQLLLLFQMLSCSCLARVWASAGCLVTSVTAI
jgi:hypothetical protein